MCGNMATSCLHSEQFLRLNSEEKKRYLSNIVLLGEIDLYTMKMGGLSGHIETYVNFTIRNLTTATIMLTLFSRIKHMFIALIDE